MLGFDGATAIAPIPMAAAPSLLGAQVVPPLVVFHTPLPGFPMKTVFLSVGSMAMAEVQAPQWLVPSMVGVGPIALQGWIGTPSRASTRNDWSRCRAAAIRAAPESN